MGIPEARPYVLVVDDDAETRLACATALQDIGIDSVAVSDGEAALNQCMHRDPAIAVLDLALPGLDGVAFEAAYRKLPRSGARIIVLRGTPRGAETAARMRADAYVSKPFELHNRSARGRAGSRTVDELEATRVALRPSRYVAELGS